MRHTIYWVTLDCKGGGIDLFLNDVPVVRLGPSHGVRRPLNEYTRRSGNRVELRIGSDGRAPLPPSTALPPTGEDSGSGEAKLLIEAVEYLRGDEIGRATLIEQAVPKNGAMGMPIFTGTFEAGALRGGLPDLALFSPIGPGERAAVMNQLNIVADWWRAGDAEALLGWIDPYVKDFTDSYAAEDYEDYRSAFRAMVADMGGASAQVSYDPGRVRLAPCGDGKLVQCLRDDGRAAISVSSAEIESYDFELIAGVERGQVVAVR